MPVSQTLPASQIHISQPSNSGLPLASPTCSKESLAPGEGAWASRARSWPERLAVRMDPALDPDFVRAKLTYATAGRRIL